MEEDPIVKFVPSTGPDPEPLDLSFSNNIEFENGPIMEIDISNKTNECFNEENSSTAKIPNNNINYFNLESSNHNLESSN